MLTSALLTSQVLINHVWSMFHKETKHGGATRSTLQPEQDRSVLLARLLDRSVQRESLRSELHLVET